MIVDKTMFMRLFLSLLGLFILLFGIALFRYNTPAPEDLSVEDEEYWDEHYPNPSYKEETEDEPESDPHYDYVKIPAGPEQYVAGSAVMPDGLTLIYSTDIGTSSKNIWRKIGNSHPELLATLQSEDKGQGYGLYGVMDINRAQIAFNVLNKAIDVVSLQDKEKRRLFSAKDNEFISSFNFSPDSSNLIVITTQSPNTWFPPFFLHVIDLRNRKEIKQYTLSKKEVNSPQGLGIVSFRDDVLVYIPWKEVDCVESPALIDLSKTNPLSTSTYQKYTYITQLGYAFSEDGTRAIGDSVEKLENRTNGPSGCGESYIPTVMSVVDPVSGRVFGTVGKPGIAFEFVMFSPDNTKVLFKEADYSGDGYKLTQFYQQEIGFGTKAILVENPVPILKEWKGDTSTIHLVNYRSQSDDDNSLYLGKEKIFGLDRAIYLIAQYFE